jgi:DivIVA domain-containing protein
MSEYDGGTARGLSTPWRLVRSGLLGILGYAVVGAAAGVVWEAVWTPPGQVVAQHQVFFDSYASLRQVFTGTGWYVVVGTVASALASLVVCLFTRHRALLTLALVIVGSAIGAAVMLKVGTSLGPADPATIAAHTVKRTAVAGALTVDGTSHLGVKSPYLVWPTASLVVLALVFIVLPVPPLPRDRRDPFPLTPRRTDVAPSTQPGDRSPEVAGSGGGRHQLTRTSDDRTRLAEEIRSVRFTPVRFRRGYDMGAVDRLLDAAAGAIRRGEPVAALLAPALPTVSWHEAYDRSEVDTFLQTLRNSATAMDAHG